MAIEEKEAQETLLKELIEKVEKDPIPTHIFTTEDTDPLVLLGKLNEIIAKLKDLRALYISSDTKATQALDNAINALANATQALQSANTALSTANTAIDTANTALDTANTAIDISNDAIDTATALGNEAKEIAETLGSQANNKADNAITQANEALRVAQEALSQIIVGLGSKVYDISGNLLTNAKFKGDNGINVDMSEDDPETFDIRLDDTITKAIEDNNTLAQNNKTSIETLSETSDTMRNSLTALNEEVQGVKQAQASDSLAIVELQSKNLTQEEEIGNLQGDVTANSQKLQRALLLPVSTPSEQKLVGVGTDNVQDLIGVGDGLTIIEGKLKNDAPFSDLTFLNKLYTNIIFQTGGNITTNTYLPPLSVGGQIGIVSYRSATNTTIKLYLPNDGQYYSYALILGNPYHSSGGMGVSNGISGSYIAGGTELTSIVNNSKYTSVMVIYRRDTR